MNSNVLGTHLIIVVAHKESYYSLCSEMIWEESLSLINCGYDGWSQLACFGLQPNQVMKFYLSSLYRKYILETCLVTVMATLRTLFGLYFI